MLSSLKGGIGALPLVCCTDAGGCNGAFSNKTAVGARQTAESSVHECECEKAMEHAASMQQSLLLSLSLFLPLPHLRPSNSADDAASPPTRENAHMHGADRYELASSCCACAWAALMQKGSADVERQRRLRLQLQRWQRARAREKGAAHAVQRECGERRIQRCCSGVIVAAGVGVWSEFWSVSEATGCYAADTHCHTLTEAERQQHFIALLALRTCKCQLHTTPLTSHATAA